MDFGVLGGHALDAVSSVVGGLFNANQARKNRAFQERMYEKEKADKIEFWKMQNEYDLPSAQLQRLKDAGMNPLLAYGQGGNVANTGSQLSTPSAPSGSAAQAQFHTNFGLAMQQAKLLKAQIANVESDTEKKTQDALLAAENVVKTRIDAEKSRQEGIGARNENMVFHERWQLNKEAMIAENNLKREYANTEVSKRNEIEAVCDNLDKQNEMIDNQISNNDRLTTARIKEIEQNIENSLKLTISTIRLQSAEQRKAIAEAYEARMRAALISDPVYRKAFTEKEVQAVKNMIEEGNIEALEKELKQRMLDMMPKQGDPSFEFKSFMERWVYPISDIVGRALGGANSAVDVFGKAKKL